MKTTDEIEVPKGVVLRDFGDYDASRQAIFDGALKAVSKSFPMSFGGVRMEVDDLGYEKRDNWTKEEQKRALLEDRYLARRLRGRVKLVDEATGQLLEQKKLSLMRVPYLTSRGTIVHGGNEYTSIMQSRLLPGAYTRRQENGALETQFNTKMSKAGFRVGFEPDTAQYRLKVGQANLHMYSLLKDLGVPDEDLEKRWGKEILEANQRKYDSRVFEKAYERFVSPRERTPEATREDKAAAIRGAFDRAEVNAWVMRRNLPNAFNEKRADEWRARWAGRQLTIEKIASEDVFAPDMDPSETFDATADSMVCKAAGDTWDEVETSDPGPSFDPDLKPGDLKKEYANLYGKQGDRLAGMKSWPKEWMPPGSDQLGWLNWYFGYADGKRTDDDERQMGRWKSFKARHLSQFLKNPTPRRAYALRMWAIDPLSYLDEEASDSMARRMRSYMQDKLEKAAYATGERGPEVQHTLADLINAKAHSDAGRMGDKAFLVQRSMMERPDEWVVDSPGGKTPGVTHVPTGFRLHIPASRIPPQVAVDESYALQQQAGKKQKQAEKSAAFNTRELQAVAQFLNREHGAGIPLAISAPEIEQAIVDFINGQGGNPALLEGATDALENTRKQIADQMEAALQPKAAAEMVEEGQEVKTYEVCPHCKGRIHEKGDSVKNWAEVQAGYKEARRVPMIYVHNECGGEFERPEPDWAEVQPWLRPPWYGKEASVEEVSEPRYLHSWVPAKAYEAIKQHGLLSGDELAKPENRHLLELARSGQPDPDGPQGGDSADAWMANREKTLREHPDWEFYKGPSALFGPVDPDKIHDKHPLKRFDSKQVRINLDALLKDHPDTRLRGTELSRMSSDEEWEAMSEEEREAEDFARVHDLTLEEVDVLRAKTPQELWEGYNDPKGVRYASNVPHAAVITPDGKIDPKYLEFPEEERGYPHLEEKRKILAEFAEKMKPYGNYFALGEGASVSQGMEKDELIGKLRQVLADFERARGEDPDHDWGEEYGLAQKAAAAIGELEKPEDPRPYRERVEAFGLRGGKVLGGKYDYDKTFGVYGGGVDPGEDILEAAAREFEEESGYKLLNPRLAEGVDPVIMEWEEPYKSEKQRERAKEFRGTKTYYVTGDVGPASETAHPDNASNLTDVGDYDLAGALAMVGDPELNPQHAARRRVLELLGGGQKQALDRFTKMRIRKGECTGCGAVLGEKAAPEGSVCEACSGAKEANVVVSGHPNDFTVDTGKLEEQRSQVNQNPTEKQKDSGVYRKGHIRLNGLDISIENPKGSTRKGTSKSGVSWEVELGADYGYIRGTKGKDGDHLDVFLGPDLDSEAVFVVDQVNPGGGFDEHKAVIGCKNREAAKELYLSCYSDGWKCGSITSLTMEQFKWWASEGDITKPLSAQDWYLKKK